MIHVLADPEKNLNSAAVRINKRSHGALRITDRGSKRQNGGFRKLLFHSEVCTDREKEENNE